MEKKFKKFEEWKGSLVVGKNPCYRCRKSGNDSKGDNFEFYGEDRGGTCFSCDFKLLSKEYLEKIGADNYEYKEEDDLMAKEFSRDWWLEFRKTLSFSGNGYRGIRDDVLQTYQVMHAYNTDTGDLEAQYYPITTSSKLSGVKCRMMPKDFESVGAVGKNADLFGQFLFKDNSGKFVVICAGEIDALSGYQILEDERLKKKSTFDPIPVVSPTIGESGAVKQLQAQYEWLSRFEKIIVCFDNDDAGKEAVEKIAKALPKGKVFVMNIRRKDTNAHIWDKDNNKPLNYSQEWINAFWKAEKWTPSGVIGSYNLLDSVREAMGRDRVPLPPFAEKLQKMMGGGIPLKHIVNLASASGTGKSTIADEFIYFWLFNSPYKVGIVTLEADKEQYGTNLLSRHMGFKINLLESVKDRLEYINRKDVIKKANELFRNDDESDSRFHLVDNRDSGIVELQELVTQMIIECGVQIIVLDPLQDILDGSSNEEQANFLSWMKGMLKSHDVVFINVNHVRKNGGGQKANSTGAELFEEDMHGSSTIVKSGGCNLLFTRDKEAECEIERNTTYMKSSKIRWTGRTGAAGEYFYDINTHTIHDREKMPGMPKGKPQKDDKKGGKGSTQQAPKNKPNRFFTQDSLGAPPQDDVPDSARDELDGYDHFLETDDNPDDMPFDLEPLN